MNPQDQTKALATPVVSIGLEWEVLLLFTWLKLDDDNLCKYVVQRDGYKRNGFPRTKT